MKCENCGLDNLSEARFCANCGAALITVDKQSLSVELATHTKPVAAIEYIGFWERSIAAIIDAVAVWIISSALSFLIGVSTSSYLFLYWYFNPFFLLLLYYWLFTGLRGQTPGKMIVGIKVVDAKGNKPGLLSAALREIPGKIISTIIFYIGFFWIAWDTHKQGLHDKIATTYVIKVEKGN